MKQWFPILALLAGLGSAVSCKQIPQASQPAQTSQVKAVASGPKSGRIGSPSTDPNPFTRYIANAQANWPEPALVRLAAECKMDIETVSPRYALRLGMDWIPVDRLSDPRTDQGKHAFFMAAAWHTGDRALLELWTVGPDSSDYVRDLYCFEKRKVTLADHVIWQIDMKRTKSKDTTWGFEQRWRVVPKGDDVSTLRQFVDLYERPTKIPGVSPYPDDPVDDEGLEVLAWADLQLPDSLLQ